MENKIGKNAKLLIASDLIYTLTSVFIETFLVAYFLKVTNENITTISIYYILIYTLLKSFSSSKALDAALLTPSP